MFDKQLWCTKIGERLKSFVRSPLQNVQLCGGKTIFGTLTFHSLAPFLEAFRCRPISAVITLAEITSGPGADYLVHQAHRLYFQGTRLLERELLANNDLCNTVEQLLTTLQVIPRIRQRFSSIRDEWFCQRLGEELTLYPTNLFVAVRRQIENSGWKLRLEAIVTLKERNGVFSPEDLELLYEGLHDSSSEVRQASARRIGEFVATPPLPIVKTLVHMAIHDHDVKTRRISALALGHLRNRIVPSEIIDYVTQHLSDKDPFFRSAAAMLLVELGDTIANPHVIERLVELLRDSDAYVREAAALALGRMGPTAVTKEVMMALIEAGDDNESAVHEAAIESLMRLRRLRSTLSPRVQEATKTTNLVKAINTRKLLSQDNSSR